MLKEGPEEGVATEIQKETMRERGTRESGANQEGVNCASK